MESHLVRLLDLLRSGEVAPGQANLVPRTIQQPHPTLWIGGGLHQQSCDLAVKYNLPLILPSLFRYPDDYLPMLAHYREGLASHGLEGKAQVGLPSYCWVAPTSQQARAQWRPRLDHYVEFARSLRSGFGRDLDFDTIIAGPGICGSPAEVVDKLSQINEKLNLDSHILLMDVGGMPFDELRAALELFGTDVLPHLQSR
jgi:alkanesulfonate monooxygenase SsuD/methylene tetrahydromethanopterin reductase-like flavin-dependent oxidoreductase (luciferase family)